MLKLRKTHAEVFVHGGFRLVDEENAAVFSFIKTAPNGQAKALVVCNFSDRENELPHIKGVRVRNTDLLLDNVSDTQSARCAPEKRLNGADSSLRPWEGRVYLLGMRDCDTAQTNGH